MVINNIREQLIAARKEAGITQKELADMLGVAQPNIARFENTNTPVIHGLLIKIATALGKKIEIKLK